MTIEAITTQLETNKHVFKTLLKNKTEAEYLWKPQPEKWCLLEIVCHLIDEEVEDFRARTNHVLESPAQDMMPINPNNWVKERNYASRNYQTSIDIFLKERNKSIKWLKSKTEANWDNVFVHHVLGNMSANLFLANWLAHDYLHMRQILRYQYQYLAEKSRIDLQYAGNW
ncbi:DinB family protein [uncultured Algibacter sp.]|uniref:DinB family protein n=1 Tax=uncultured Algibacter sp. TaxID=298659 RepID=UPI0026171221|nr:DinB family protein [uncultured Algibacter sp.]